MLPTDRTRRRFLLATAEPHPTYRADVRVLFGKWLPANGIETDLVAVYEGRGRPPPWPGGRLFAALARSGFASRMADAAQQVSLLWRCFGGYDGLIVRDQPLLGLIGFVAARLARIPYVYWMSFPMPEAYLAIASGTDGSAGPLRRAYAWLRGTAGSLALYRLIVPRADFLFVQSALMLEQLRANGLSHTRAEPVPMGVDDDAIVRLPAGRASGEAGRNAHSAVYLGNLSRLRSTELKTMVDAAKEVGVACPDFVLSVVGEGDTEAEKGWLRRYAETTGASPFVFFHGWLPNDAAFSVAMGSAVGLSPFPRGPLFDSASPTKVVEYMALGLPVVCNDQPDQAQVVQQSRAGFCVEMSAAAFASAILQLLHDPENARAMGASGQAWVARNRAYRHLAARVASVLRTIPKPVARDER